VRAIEDTGLTVKLGNLLLHLSGGTSFGAVLAGTVGSALGTNLINNVPIARRQLPQCTSDNYTRASGVALDRGIHDTLELRPSGRRKALPCRGSQTSR